jgi:hypothetical protein
MGYIPHVGMSTFREGHTPTRYLIKDQVAPEHFWGLIHQGTRPRINPCPRHGYPGIFPGALDISRDFNCLVPDQEPQSDIGGPLRGLYCLVLLPPYTHLWETWKKSSIHSVCPWGQVRVKVLSPNPQLLRLGQLLAKPRGVVPNKNTKAFKLSTRK